MNWNTKDIELFKQEKDYIDTAFIPLLPIAFDDAMKRTAEQGEFTQLLTVFLERQFKGRMVVLPPYTYMGAPIIEYERINQWAKSAKENGFTYVFFLTADQRWNPLKNNLSGSLYYVPSIPLEHMEETYIHAVMQDQLQILLPNLIKEWQRPE